MRSCFDTQEVREIGWKEAGLLRARGKAELGKIVSGSTTHGLWLRDRKVESQVMGEDRSQFNGKGTVGMLGEEEEEPATEQRREYTDLGLDLGEREEQVACRASALAMAMTDEARREAEM